MSKRSKKTDEVVDFMKAVLELGRVAGSLGWVIAIPDQDSVNHLVIGKKEKVIKIVEDIGEDYTVMEKPELN